MIGFESSADAFSERQVAAMRAAGGIAAFLDAELRDTEGGTYTREYRATASDGTELAVTVEPPDDPLPQRLGEAWEAIMPEGYFEDHLGLDVIPVAIVSAGSPASTDRDNYYVYHVIGGVNEVAADSLPDPDILPDQNPLGIVVAGSVKLYHELQPTEQLFGPADDDGCGHFAEVTIAEPTTDYYIADGTGVTILGDTVHAALDGGFELPPIREQ